MTPTQEAPSTDARAPSVLAVLVVKDGAPWLRECLQGLADQGHERLGILAVDNGSTDGSREALEAALGSGRVLAPPGNPGVAGALSAALDLPAAQEADYLLLIHDDTVLAAGAVDRLLEAAEGIRGVERVGVVGPKVVDWEDPRVLREVGRSTDRFGHPYTALQNGERDHGQYDRVLEVLFVSSCAMLISRETWQRTGRFDERLASHHDDLDFCWRARMAGFRVLMTPLAQARHRGASLRGERVGERHRSARYYAERAALASMLKNYGLLSLLWLLPLYAVLGVGRLALLSLTRRFEDAFELLMAWGWNLAHLPGTLRRRVRAQAARTVRDRTVRRFMESAAVRVPRWFESAGRILAEQQGEDEGEAVPIRSQAVSMARAHPALVAWSLAVMVCALAYRHFFGPEAVTGGVIAAFPAHPGDFWRELVSAVRTTGLGGTQAASPALGALGAAAAIPFASPALAQKLFLLALPLVGAVVAYRASMRETGQRVAAVVAGSAYGLSAVMLWAFSQGRVGLLVGLAVLPALAERLDVAFGRLPTHGSWRLAAGLAVTVAIGAAFEPGILLAAGVLVIIRLLFGPSRGRGLALSLWGFAMAAALTFPVLPDLLRGVGLSSLVGPADFGRLGRLSLGTAPGSSATAWFLPAAAVIGFGLASGEQRGRAFRSMLAAVAGLFLAWASAAGYLPAALANAPIYMALGAASMAALVGQGLASALSGRIGRHAFGRRQVGVGLIALVTAAGLGGQAVDAAIGDWGVGPDRQPATWQALVSTTHGDFRVLWVGRDDGRPFPAPGGDPTGVVDAGPASLRYAITDRTGLTALDTGRGATGPGYDYAAGALDELLAGTTGHLGALLAPVGVGYVIAETGNLPPEVTARLDAQLDLDRVPSEGLAVYRNARALPPAAELPDANLKAVGGSELIDAARFLPQAARPIEAVSGEFVGESSGSGVGLIDQQIAGAWRLEPAGGEQAVLPSRAFGWAMAFPLPAGPFSIRYSQQWVRTAELLLLALLWLFALWFTRKPVSR